LCIIISTARFLSSRVVLILKKLLFCMCFAIAVLSLGMNTAAADISAQSAIVYEPYTQTVLFEQNVDARLLIASTTKIMTALVVLEHADLSEPVEVSADHAAVEGSSMYLQPGERYTVEDLLYGLLLASGNDAAAALADHCTGSMEAFAALMNEKAEKLGLQNTHFVNAHGLDDPDHYSSARDLALLTAAAMENPTFARIFACRSYTCNGINYVNHNKLLESCDGCIGGKTGYTNAAGRVLVSCAERDGMRLIVVTISDPEDWTDHAALYDEIFSAYRYLKLPGSAWGRLSLISGTKSHVALACDVPGILLARDESPEVRVYLPRFLYAPTLRGAVVGRVEVTAGGEVREYLISAAEGIPLDPSAPLTAWEQFKRAWFAAKRYPGIYYRSM